MGEYRICHNCIMDTSDPDIIFNQDGACHHCQKYGQTVAQELFTGDEGERKLDAIVATIKEAGKGRQYDCIIGVSGGVDSTYVAYKVKQLGLRALAVHLDNGWNSELSVSNIEKTVKTLGIDLYTYVMDWEEFRDLQLSFLKASVPDLEIPTDHAILAILYRMAAREKVKYIILGRNVTTEAIGVGSWSMGHADWHYINSIQKQFGTRPLKSFPHYSLIDLFYYRVILGQKIINVLNYVSYSKEEAMKVLQNELGWQYYGGKHYESIYTKFIQAYILPEKFGFDKRKAHLSTLICSGQMTRDEALAELGKELYPQDQLREDREFVVKKLGIQEEDFRRLMALPKKSFWDYPSYHKMWIYKRIRDVYRYFWGNRFD